MKTRTVVITPLGTFKGKVVEVENEKELEEKLETLKEHASHLSYLNFEDDDGSQILILKETIQRSVIKIERV